MDTGMLKVLKRTLALEVAWFSTESTQISCFELDCCFTLHYITVRIQKQTFHYLGNLIINGDRSESYKLQTVCFKWTQEGLYSCVVPICLTSGMYENLKPFWIAKSSTSISLTFWLKRFALYWIQKQIRRSSTGIWFAFVIAIIADLESSNNFK
jgi:hypothetical protein